MSEKSVDLEKPDDYDDIEIDNIPQYSGLTRLTDCEVIKADPDTDDGVCGLGYDDHIYPNLNPKRAANARKKDRPRPKKICERPEPVVLVKHHKPQSFAESAQAKRERLRSFFSW